MKSEENIKREFNKMFEDKTKEVETQHPKCNPPKPIIFDRGKGQHYCFCINDIYKHLFIGDRANNVPPYIFFPSAPHKQLCKSKLGKFLLPAELYSQISRITIEKENETKPYVSDKDWQEYLTLGSKNTKIHNVMFDLFSNERTGSEIKFIKKLQLHFIRLLKSAEFSPELKNCLAYWGKTVFVPKNKSPKAYEAFKCMVNGNHDSLSKTIANIFVSSMIGLYPVNYGSSKDSRTKTYILNKLGIEFIWIPEIINNSYIKLHDAFQLYEDSKYDEAYERGLEWLINNHIKSTKSELAKAYLLLGKCLYLHPQFCNPDNLPSETLSDIMIQLDFKHCSDENISDKTDKTTKAKQKDGILFLKKSCKLDDTTPDPFYLLYIFTKNDSIETAFVYLKTAFALNHTKAVIDVAFMYLNDEQVCNDINEEKVLEKINNIIKTESENAPSDIGKCFYLRGEFAKKNGNEPEAQIYFEIAAKKGNERAKLELVRKERSAERGIFPSFSNQPKVNCCFANTLTGKNYQVISTFPNNEWALFAPVKTTLKGIQYVRDINEFINLQHIGEFEFSRSKIVFLLMSDDKEKNLNNCLALLDKLFNTALEIPDKQKWELIDNIYIFVNADYETASMLIDANINQMGNDIYFKVHIADENRDTVHKLLCDAPLFLPALNGAKSENSTKVVLFGSSEINYCFVKESIASAYLGGIHPIEITLLGENADLLERRFRQECPGVFDYPSITCIRPNFIKCSIKETDFPKLIGSGQSQIKSSKNKVVQKKDTDEDITEALSCGNYFIVDYADDLENIRFAMNLRTWLLRSRDSFDRAPFIGVKVSDKQNSYLTSHLTLTGQAAGNSYYNKYDLFPFGISAQTYHYKNIIEDPVLNRIALQIHKFYYLDNDLDKNYENKLKEALKKCKRSAENDFYSYSYNADSSTSTAIGLCYRFFAAKCILSNKEEYLDFGALKSQDILSNFSVQLNSDNKETLAKIEQSRWNSFMLIRGWLPANKTQVEAYEEQSSGVAHKHILAKLHPFIREWGDLDDPELEKTLGILKIKANYNKKPQVTTRRSIEDTTRFFISESKENEKSH